MTTVKRKLIEVALPLETINREAAREKLVRHGHPSTLHLWWARRPLAACRAVIFAQLVDDPSSDPERFPSEQAQEAERQRLFKLIESLAVWENANNGELISRAREEIIRSTGGRLPVVIDPFSGGGSIPLEAQRLGLEVEASDLNPVAVLINRAMLELPSQWASCSPVHPSAVDAGLDWPAATGLAEDVRAYAMDLRNLVEKHVRSLYPEVRTEEGSVASPIAWIWARTMACPNPACGVPMPLVRSFWLAQKKGKEAWIRVSVDDKRVRYFVETGSDGPPIESTVGRTGAVCIGCGTPVSLQQVRKFAQLNGLGTALMAIVIQGERRRRYISPTVEQEAAAHISPPDNLPDEPLPVNPRDFKTPNYGMKTFASLFSARQQHLMTTYVSGVSELRLRVVNDAGAAGMTAEDAERYADAVALYLGLIASRMADRHCTLCAWMPDPKNENARNVFARQALPMVWDFAEVYPFGEHSGNSNLIAKSVSDVIMRLPASGIARVEQLAAQSRSYADSVVCTDPPYYDNIGYADLSDFFYVWLRRAVADSYPSETATLLAPKAEELVASPYRFEGGQAEADAHFEQGFVETFTRIRRGQRGDFPLVLFYAFKQSSEADEGISSTGWETMLQGLLEAGLAITATWPMRTEMAGRLIGKEKNVLASSIVITCRPRGSGAPATNRRGFLGALATELPKALHELQQGCVAPVDLAQASIGPGMAVFSRYARVLEMDGSEMSVRTALSLINHALSEVLEKQEGDFDPESRFAIKWFTQFGWNEGSSGEADVLTRAVNTSVSSLERGGIFKATAGKAKLLAPEEMSAGWDPAADRSVSVWEVAVRVGHSVGTEGVPAAAELLSASAHRVDLGAVKELAYLMYSVCEMKGWTEAAMLFNGLGSSWLDLESATRVERTPTMAQEELNFDTSDDMGA